MANRACVTTPAAVLRREASVSDVKISLEDAPTAFQLTAAALMAVHSEEGIQKVINITPMLTPGGTRGAAIPGGESRKPSLASKAGISFVIPKNKLSGALVPVVRNVAGKWEPTEPKQEEETKSSPQRKTRWGVDLTRDPVVKRGRALALQTRAEQIAAQLESGQLDIDTNEATRSPSPPPIYDPSGQRINTREGRRREQLELERREAIGDCMLLNPLYKPPVGYKPVCKEAKLYIPVKDYPGYNFIGLILGPRGNTQKRMEAETGSKIAIRGKGAVKEGKKSNAVRLQGGRRDGKDADGAFDDLHVHITADSIEKVDAAVALIEPLLTPVDVSCKACGDGGHPTMDCPRKHSGQGKMLDKEYLSFLEELRDGLVGASAGSTPGLSKSTADETVKQEPPKVAAASAPAAAAAPAAGPHEISETSLDPNQLADVISGPQPMLITASGPQPIPPAWSSVGTIPSVFEPRVGPQQQGNFGQVDENRQFFEIVPNGLRPPMHLPPTTGGFNIHPSPPFPYYGNSPHSAPPQMFNGHPPASINVSGGAPPLPPGQQGLQQASPTTHGQERGSSGADFTPVSGKEEGSNFFPFPGPSNGTSLGMAPQILDQSFHSVPQSMPMSNSLNQFSLGPFPQNPSSMPAPPVPVRPPLAPPWAAASPSSSGSTTAWSHNAMSQQQQRPTGNIPMMWENGPHSKPPPALWDNGSPQPSPVWQLPPRPPPQGSEQQQPSSSPWPTAKQKPWEVLGPCPPFSPQPPPIPGPPPVPNMGGVPNPSWNPSLLKPPLPSPRLPPGPPSTPPPPPLSIPPSLNQTWNELQQPQNFRQLPGTGLGPGPGPSLWNNGPPNPFAGYGPASKPPHPSHQAPPVVGPSHIDQSPSQQSYPSWPPQQAQPSHKFGTFTNFGGPKMVPITGGLPHPQFPGPQWAHQPGGANPSRPDRRSPAAPMPPNQDSGGRQAQSYDPFVPTAASTAQVATTNVQQQKGPPPMIPGSGPGSGPGPVPAVFNGLPELNSGRGQQPVLGELNVGTNQLGLPVGRPPWQLIDKNLRPPGPPVLLPAPPATQEVDAEYEKLMASVGVK